VRGLNNRMTNLQIKVAGIAGGVTVLLMLLKELILK